MALSNASHGAVSVGTTAVLIKAATANRNNIQIHNNGTVLIYIGTTAGVTTATGMPIPAGDSKTFITESALYGISGTAAQDVRYFEEGL